MTKEQAIKFANCLKNNYTIDFNDMVDFCDTVIHSLEQQSDGCITREQAIQKAKEQYSEIWDCDINHPKYEDTVEEIVTGVIRLIMQSPTDDCVSLEVYKQVSWERDIAIAQLKELGYDFGEKIRTSDDCMSRAEVDKLCVRYLKSPTDEHVAFYEEFCSLPPVTPIQRWIPVSEELPKENGWYQCTVILNDLPRTMELFYKNGKWLDNRRINMFDTYDIYGYGNTKEKHKLSYQELISEFEWNQVVIAWQPLPKPYEEKRGNENA